MAQKKDSGRRGAGGSKASTLALALWVLAALVLFILFAANQKKIVSNLKTTGFFYRVFGRTPAFVANAPEPVLDISDKNDVEPIAPVELSVTSGTPGGGASGASAANDAARTYSARAQGAMWTEEDDDDLYAAAPSEAGEAEPEAATPRVPVDVPTMNLKLFFMIINSDGSVTRREVTRAMPQSGSPLSASIRALIDGPNADEDKLGCRSLISNGTRLLSASVRNGVATLNFSGEFEFNQYGIEGTRGQLQQIVYTATAFPTVESVQFLVDGDKREYLGSEGVWIGTPLGRSSFL